MMLVEHAGLPRSEYFYINLALPLFGQDIGNINIFIKMFKQRVVNHCTLEWHLALENSSRCEHYNNFKR